MIKFKIEPFWEKEMSEFKAQKIKEIYQEDILSRPNVIGTGIGKNDNNSESTIIVFVEEKMPDEEVIQKYSAENLIPQKLDGVPIKVIEVGKIIKQGYQSRIRPIRPGYSIGHGSITAGTLGGFFKDKDGDIIALTNNHVAAAENKASNGDIIYQPGPMDAGRGTTRFSGWTEPAADLPYFGTLKRFVPLNRSNNLHDSAIIKVHPSYLKLINPIYPHIEKPIAGFSNIQIGQAVQKCGRTTGYTKGKIIAQHGTFTIGYDFGGARFNDCIVATTMSSGGDSGSLVFDDNMNAIGLLFAGSNKVTLINPIHYVINEYGLTPYAGEIRSQKLESNRDWTLIATAGNIQVENDSMLMECMGNSKCYIEKNLENFNTISLDLKLMSKPTCIIDAGLEIAGAKQKIGLKISNGALALMYNDDKRVIKLVQLDDNSFTLRLQKDGIIVKPSIHHSDTWHKFDDVLLEDGPFTFRIGQINPSGSAGQDLIACEFFDLKIY